MLPQALADSWLCDLAHPLHHPAPHPRKKVSVRYSQISLNLKTEKHCLAVPNTKTHSHENMPLNLVISQAENCAFRNCPACFKKQKEL